jgi:ABC-2 type transport system permease protein
MDKLWVIIQREYNEFVKKKSFIISTLLTPVFLAVLTILPTYLANLKSDKPLSIGVIDLSGQVYEDLHSALNDTLKTGEKIYRLQKIELRENLDSTIAQFEAKVEAESLTAFLVLGADIFKDSTIEYHSKSIGNFRQFAEFEGKLSSVIVDKRLKAMNLEVEKIRPLTQRINLKFKKTGKEKKSETDILGEYVLGITFTVILFTMILNYGQHLTRVIVEEKNSRIVEILLSSTNSFKLMLGKILGLGAASLTQVLIWFVLGGILFLYIRPSLGANFSFSALNLHLLIYFVPYLILGYFLYSTFFALIGAISNSDREAQSFMFPISISLVMPMILATLIVQNPDNQLIKVLSLIPIFTPTMMVMRISFLVPATGEIVLSFVLLILSILTMGWITAKIFRVGILMYGKRPTLPELIRWVKYK